MTSLFEERIRVMSEKEAEGLLGDIKHKKVVILANSKKLDDRCIAGREAKGRRGKLRFGAWIRPVSLQGSISAKDSDFKDRRQPQLLAFLNSFL